MDAGGKHWLRKIIKSANARQANTYRLHYFPNIPARGERHQDTVTGNAVSHGPHDARGPGGPSGGQVPPAADHGPTAANPALTDRGQLDATARQAYAEGFAQGERDAKQLAEERISPLVTTLENLLAEITSMRKNLQRQIENEVVDLALHIGRKIVGQAFQTDRDAVGEIVREALKHAEDPEKICIRLNPADLQHLQKASGFESLSASERIQLEEDSTIDAGGCLVQTEYGEIDARIEEQFRTIEEAFRAETMSLPREV